MTKERFATLDAMRGVAALTVLLFHIQGLYGPACVAISECNVRFGYLAVDMFFALSGFVLSYRYDVAFADGLRFAKFMRLRFVRLMPIYWLGLLIGTVGLLLDLRLGASLGSTAKVIAFNAVLLPSPTFHTHIDLFPVDSPAWSLFLEIYVANVLFALLGSRLRAAALSLLVAASFIGLIVVEARFGNINVGWLWADIAGGFPRVTFSFFAGVGVQRLHRRWRPPTVPAVAVLGVLILSFVLRLPVRLTSGYELVCVGLLFPALIYLGASARERRPRLGKMLGDASYALYVIHNPLLLLTNRAMASLAIAPGWALAGGFTVVALMLAVGIDAFYDRRARNIMALALDRVTSAGSNRKGVRHAATDAG